MKQQFCLIWKKFRNTLHRTCHNTQSHNTQFDYTDQHDTQLKCDSWLFSNKVIFTNVLVFSHWMKFEFGPSDTSNLKIDISFPLISLVTSVLDLKNFHTVRISFCRRMRFKQSCISTILQKRTILAPIINRNPVSEKSRLFRQRKKLV